MKYYLAIDQGTHSSRACLFDETGKLVCDHAKKIMLNRLSNTRVEQDADEIVNSVRDVVSNVLSESKKQNRITACGIATQRSSVVAWLQDGTAISPVLNWQDTRGESQLKSLNEYTDEIQQISGLPLSAHYGASKLNYLLNTTPQQTDTASLRLSPLISYLLHHTLDGQPYIVDHCNAQRTQLFSLHTMKWSDRLTELFAVPARYLPECVPVIARTSYGKLAGTDIPVNVISGDQNAAIFGAGRLDSDTALINFGSGAFILHMLSRFSLSKKQLTGIARSDYENVQYLREATINGAASALTWLENKYNVADIWKRLPEWLENTRQPPVFINSIGGLGSPWWRSEINEKFVVVDQAGKSSAEQIAQQAVAIIESIVFMVCANLEIMQSEQTITCLRVSGGLSLLDGLCQRLADLSGLRVERVKLTEATARGTAWLAAGGPDNWNSLEFEVFEPAFSSALQHRYTLFTSTLRHMLK